MNTGHKKVRRVVFQAKQVRFLCLFDLYLWLKIMLAIIVQNMKHLCQKKRTRVRATRRIYLTFDPQGHSNFYVNFVVIYTL